MNIVIAEGALLDHILDHTFEVWHEGLSRAAYGRWSTGQLRTPWARQYLQRFALLDDRGALLASLKAYRYRVLVGGRDGWMCGIGAVFTPRPFRGRGYASRLVNDVIERARGEGACLAALFSEIGAEFYQRLGFEPVLFDEMTVDVSRRHGGAPAMLVRAGEERDLSAIASMHNARGAAAPFSLTRDASMVQYQLTKKRLLAGLGPPGLRQLEFFVAEEGASAVAYVILNENANGWTLEDAGDRDPAGARLGAMLQVLLAREPSHHPPLIRAWWPRAFPVPPQLALKDRSEPRDLFMVRPLADVPMPRSADDVFYWRMDNF
jgi:GNAT superfamily N-acetyltransferase